VHVSFWLGQIKISFCSLFLLSFSRESLIGRTLEDISDFDRPKAEAEVDKFLMDAEMVSHATNFLSSTRKKGNNLSSVVHVSFEFVEGLVRLIHLLVPPPLFKPNQTKPNHY
jgi:hypothetical protein